MIGIDEMFQIPVQSINSNYSNYSTQQNTPNYSAQKNTHSAVQVMMVILSLFLAIGGATRYQGLLGRDGPNIGTTLY